MKKAGRSATQLMLVEQKLGWSERRMNAAPGTASIVSVVMIEAERSKYSAQGKVEEQVGERMVTGDDLYIQAAESRPREWYRSDA